MKKYTLELYTGPMWSGKSHQLIKKYYNLFSEDGEALAFKHVFDTREPKGRITSREEPEKFITNIIRVEGLHSLTAIIEEKKPRLVFIDEAHFFDKNYPLQDISYYCMKIAYLSMQGIQFFISGLNYDYKKQVFHTINKLTKHCSKNQILKAHCSRCGTKFSAEYTKNLVPIEGSFAVGDNELYAPMCSHCFDKSLTYQIIENIQKELNKIQSKKQTV